MQPDWQVATFRAKLDTIAVLQTSRSIEAELFDGETVLSVVAFACAAASLAPHTLPMKPAMHASLCCCSCRTESHLFSCVIDARAHELAGADPAHVCRQGVRSEARYIRSTDTNQTDVAGVIENMILVATFGALPPPPPAAPRPRFLPAA